MYIANFYFIYQGKAFVFNCLAGFKMKTHLPHLIQQHLWRLLKALSVYQFELNMPNFSREAFFSKDKWKLIKCMATEIFTEAYLIQRYAQQISAYPTNLGLPNKSAAQQISPYCALLTNSANQLQINMSCVFTLWGHTGYSQQLRLLGTLLG